MPMQAVSELCKRRLAVATVLLPALLSCAGGGSVEYQRRSAASYPPTTSVLLYWGDDARRMSRGYSVIATSVAQWTGPDSGSFGRGYDDTSSRELGYEPVAKLPDAYRLKAMDLGAHALLIPSVKEVVQTRATPRHTLYFTTGPVDVPAGIKVTTNYTALITAIRFAD